MINFCSVDNDILPTHIESIISVKIKWQLSLHFFLGHFFIEINFTIVVVSHSLKGLSFNFVFTDSICNLVVRIINDKHICYCDRFICYHMSFAKCNGSPR